MSNFFSALRYDNTFRARIIHILLCVGLGFFIYFYVFPRADAYFDEPSPVSGKIGCSALIGYFFAVIFSFFTRYPTKCSSLAAKGVWWAVDSAANSGLARLFFVLLAKMVIIAPVLVISFFVVLVTYPFETLFLIKNTLWPREIVITPIPTPEPPVFLNQPVHTDQSGSDESQNNPHHNQ